MSRLDGVPDQYSGRNPEWTASLGPVTPDDCMDYSVALSDAPLLDCVIGGCVDKAGWVLNNRIYYCDSHRAFVVNLMGGVEWSLSWRAI